MAFENESEKPNGNQLKQATSSASNSPGESPMTQLYRLALEALQNDPLVIPSCKKYVDKCVIASNVKLIDFSFDDG